MKVHLKTIETVLKKVRKIEKSFFKEKLNKLAFSHWPFSYWHHPFLDLMSWVFLNYGCSCLSLILIFISKIGKYKFDNCENKGIKSFSGTYKYQPLKIEYNWPVWKKKSLVFYGDQFPVKEHKKFSALVFYVHTGMWLTTTVRGENLSFFWKRWSIFRTYNYIGIMKSEVRRFLLLTILISAAMSQCGDDCLECEPTMGVCAVCRDDMETDVFGQCHENTVPNCVTYGPSG